LSHKKAQVLRYLLLIPALVFALAPVYWMLTISLKTEVDQFATPPPWFGFTPTVAHYYDAFVTRSFGDYLINSAIVAVASTACALVIGTLAAYALARFQLPWRLNRHLSLWILSTRMFPAIVTAVPLFLMMRDVRLLNTRASLIIVHTAFNLPFVVWMMRGFFAELPRDLEEAALVDGDSRLGALTQTDAAMTLPVGIAGRVTQFEIKWGVMSAAATVAIVPILVFALALQKYLVRGLSMGAVKG
jgi:multiple sugar transport system permease protein